VYVVVLSSHRNLDQTSRNSYSCGIFFWKKKMLQETTMAVVCIDVLACWVKAKSWDFWVLVITSKTKTLIPFAYCTCMFWKSQRINQNLQFTLYKPKQKKKEKKQQNTLNERVFLSFLSSLLCLWRKICSLL
jgi:hypothetical protein